MEEVAFFDKDMQEIDDGDNEGLWSSLNDPSQYTYMWINGKMFEFNQPDVDVVQEAQTVEDKHWGKQLAPGRGAAIHKDTISLFVDNLERKLDEAWQGEFTVEQLNESIKESLNIFDVGSLQESINDYHISRA